MVPFQQTAVGTQMVVLDAELSELLRALHAEGTASSLDHALDEAPQVLGRLRRLEGELGSLSLIAEKLLRCRHLCGEGAAAFRHFQPAVDECELRIQLWRALYAWQVFHPLARAWGPGTATHAPTVPFDH